MKKKKDDDVWSVVGAGALILAVSVHRVCGEMLAVRRRMLRRGHR